MNEEFNTEEELAKIFQEEIDKQIIAQMIEMSNSQCGIKIFVPKKFEKFYDNFE